MQSEDRSLAIVDSTARPRSLGHLRDQAFNDADIDVIRETLCPGIDDANLKLFAHQCERTGLDPFSRQIYVIKRSGWDDGEKVDKFTIQIGIDGFRLIADRTGNYRPGDVTFAGRYTIGDRVYPESATATIYKFVRGDWYPVQATAYFAEYCQTKRNGEPTQMWASKPRIMLGKCAEMIAIRKGFPAELSGLYGDTEMEQADNPPIVREEKPRDDDAPAARAQSAANRNDSPRSDAATDAQIKALYVIARNDGQMEKGAADHWVSQRFGVAVGTLTRAQASQAIDMMKAGQWQHPNGSEPEPEPEQGPAGPDAPDADSMASDLQIGKIKELFTTLDIHGNEQKEAIKVWSGRKSANRLNLRMTEADLVIARLTCAATLTDIGITKPAEIAREIQRITGDRQATATTLPLSLAEPFARRLECAFGVMQTGILYADVDQHFATWVQRPDASIWTAPIADVDELLALLNDPPADAEDETAAEPAL